MPLYAGTIFLSAFLLFLVQPIVARQILPWFGGAAAVWTTCLVFFQSVLLAGYAYCDLLARRLAPRAQVRWHVALLVASLAALPIIPAAHWKPAGGENPLWLIIGLLAATVGPPYFLLSTTSPLLQVWFARAHPERSPYRLFALSNLASVLALVGYPFVLAPLAPTRVQAIGWSLGYAAFVIVCAAAGWASLRRARSAQLVLAVPVPERTGRDPQPEPAPAGSRQLLWGTLAATASLLLLAVSNHITQNIAAVPLLWIAPLTLYLLSFILCFDGTRWYRRQPFLALTASALGVMAWAIADPDLAHQLAAQIAIFCIGLFVACMFCHGELARLKPAPAHLTRFYLMVSLGGAGGSALVGIVAPLLLPGYFELGAGLVLCAALLLWQVRREPIGFPALAAAALLMAIGCGIWGIAGFYADTVAVARNFYGVLRVREFRSNTIDDRRSLIHGTIMHGTQYFDPQLRRQATAYYTPSSGIGRLLEALHPRLEPLRVGVIGLGTGTLAAYGARGDVYRFYEINPAVITIARRDFTYLADSAATIEIALGDARLSLERETPQRFDVLVVDAFSSDAIPLHLITAQATAIYKRHLAPGGVIAFHVTNRFVDLVPVVAAVAQANGLAAVEFSDDGKAGAASASDWLLLTHDAALLARPELARFGRPVAPRTGWRLWTDDYANVAQALR
jgi:SAM-dependent methyltransferase